MYGQPVAVTGASSALVSKQDGWAFWSMEQAEPDLPLLTVEARYGQIVLIDRENRVRFSFAARKKATGTGVEEWWYVGSAQPYEPGADESLSGAPRRPEVVISAKRSANEPSSSTFTVSPLTLLQAAQRGLESIDL